MLNEKYPEPDFIGRKRPVFNKFNAACHYFFGIAENVFWLLVVLIFSSVAKASPGEVRLFSTEWN